MSAQLWPKPSPCQTQMEMAFAGEDVILDVCGALFFPSRDLLVVSDLHLEKGSFFAARGRPMPCLDTRDTLQRLAGVLDCYRPRRVVSLGDSFHDLRAGERIAPQDAELLQRTVASLEEWIWVTGNHDPEISARFEGSAASSYKIGSIVLSHRPEDGKPPLIAGHYHPKHRFRAARQTVSGRCFVVGTSILLMPAFGAYAGGLNVLSEPIATLYDQCPRRYVMIYGNKLWALE